MTHLKPSEKVSEIVDKLNGLKFSFYYPHSPIELTTTSDAINEHNKLVDDILNRAIQLIKPLNKKEEKHV